MTRIYKIMIGKSMFRTVYAVVNGQNNPLTVVFDFDGTLANTKELELEALNIFAVRSGFQPVKNEAEFKNVIARKMFKFNFQFHTLHEQVEKLVLDYMQENISKVKIEPQMLQCIKDLYKAGYQLGILTNNREETVKKFLQQRSQNDSTLVEKYFTFVRSCKDKTLGLFQLKKDYELTNVLIYVGDQVTDIKAANSQAYSIGVTWGFDCPVSLEQAQPDYLVKSPQELAEKIACIKRGEFLKTATPSNIS